MTPDLLGLVRVLSGGGVRYIIVGGIGRIADPTLLRGMSRPRLRPLAVSCSAHG